MPFASGKLKSRIGSISNLNMFFSPAFNSAFQNILILSSVVVIEATGSAINHKAVSFPSIEPVLVISTQAIIFSFFLIFVADSLTSP